MGGRSRFDSGTGGAGDGSHIDLRSQLPGCRKRKESKLDAGGEAARIGHQPGFCNPLSVDFRKPIDIALGFVTVVLRQIDDLQAFRPGVLRPEGSALSVTGAEEEDIDR